MFLVIVIYVRVLAKCYVVPEQIHDIVLRPVFKKFLCHRASKLSVINFVRY